MKGKKTNGKQVLLVILALFAVCIVVNRIDSYSSDTYDASDYDYDKGYGYTAPEPGQSFGDYVKEQDPDLYDEIQDTYRSAVGGSGSDHYEYDDDYDYDKGYGYTAPKPGQSFSDYVKEQDPDLYDAIKGNYDAAVRGYGDD